MSKFILRHCGGCGKVEMIEASKDGITDFIVTKGWRYVPSWDSYICKDCIDGKNRDAFYEAYAGKPKCSSLNKSIAEVTNDIEEALWFGACIEKPKEEQK